MEYSVLFSIGYIAFRKSNCEENSSQAKGHDSLPRFFLLKIITLGREAALSKYPESFPSPFYILKFMVSHKASLETFRPSGNEAIICATVTYVSPLHVS